MTDAPSKKLLQDDVKNAEIVGKATPTSTVLPKSTEIPFFQQLFIWVMILLVGVIFGVGSSWTLLSQGGRTIGGVDENDILVRQGIARRLQEAINPQRNQQGEQFEFGDYNFYAKHYRYSLLAESLGLKPAGADLDQIVTEFLARPVADQPGRTHHDLLAERQGVKAEITQVELRRFLAEQTAVNALFARHLTVPAVPAAAAADLQAYIRDSIKADVVVLDASHLLPPVPADDPEIQIAYERLRPSRFATPASLDGTVAKADLNVLGTNVTVSDTEIQAKYDSSKEMYRIPASDPKADPKAPAEYRPLATVAPEIRAALTKERAIAKAQELVATFNGQIDELGLDKADKTTFAAAATKAGLVVETTKIPAPQDGMIDLGTLGRLKDPAGLHGKDVGFISNPLQASGADNTWFIVRIDAQHPAGFKDLATVKDEVIRSVAGTRAYKILMEKAEALRVAAEKRGPGGLAALLKEADQAAWKATVTEEELRPSEQLKSPASETGGVAGEGKLAVNLTLPERPVLLAEAAGNPAAADVPQVRLIQVKSFTAAPPIEAAMIPRLAGGWRRELNAWRERLYDNDLRSQIGGK